MKVRVQRLDSGTWADYTDRPSLTVRWPPTRDENRVMAPVIAEEIRRVVRDPSRYARVGLEFMLSMGLLMRDPSERVALLRLIAPYARPGVR